MCKVRTKQPNIHSNTPSNFHAPDSVLDNKETFLQKSINNNPANPHKKTFLNSYYKIKNLQLASTLEKSKKSDHQEINKTIRNLRYCAKYSLIGKTENKILTSISTSDTCNNPFCHICNRIKSAKLSSRLKAFIKDPENKDITTNKHFYFLTLTVKHDQITRNYNYLDEFKKYQERLRRSTGFRKFCNTYGKDKNAGMITSIENVISNKGYHIHSHSLIMTDKIQVPIQKLEESLRKRWRKITGDSHSLRLDLVRYDMNDKASAKGAPSNKNLVSTIMEIFKYTTKTRQVQSLSDFETDLLASWIIESKNKNMINCSGLFRGHGLTAQKCDYDVKGEALTVDDFDEYFVDKTSQLKFNVDTTKNYSTEERRNILKKVKFETVSFAALNITEVVDDFLWLFKYKNLDLPNMFDLTYRLEQMKEFRAYLQEFNQELDFEDDMNSRVKRMTSVQLNFLESLEHDFSNTVTTHSHVNYN